MIPRLLPPALFVIDAIAVYAQPAVREIRMSEIDATAILIAAIAAAPPSFIAFLAYRTSAQAREAADDAAKKAKDTGEHLVEVGKNIDGRMGELMDATGALQRAQGVVEGRGEQAQLQVQAATPVPPVEPEREP